MITALAAGAVIAAPSAALASTAAPGAAVAKIHQVPCRPWTFNVYHGPQNRPTCYEGLGTIRTAITNVHTITTGENAGVFSIRIGPVTEPVRFGPHQGFHYSPAGHAELLGIDITHT
jgi:hypothetical protein